MNWTSPVVTARGRARTSGLATGISALALLTLPVTSLGASAPPSVVPSSSPARAECPNPHGGVCLGPLAAGTYHTTAFMTPITYTVPEGWANYEDLPGNFLLVPPGGSLDGVDAGTSDYIGIFLGAAVAAECEERAEPGVGLRPTAMAEALAAREGLVVTEPVPVEVGGLPGLMIDIDLDPAQTGGCDVPGMGRMWPLIIGNGPASLHHVQGPTWTTRLYLLDHGITNVVIEVSDNHASPGTLEDYEPVIDALVLGRAASTTVPPSPNEGAGGQAPSPATSAMTADLPRIALPVEPGSTVEGLIDVGGHDIYARCAGEGSPTVVYFTGWAPEAPSHRAVGIAQGIERALGPSIRVCSYERRNTGRSDTVEGTQTPEDVIGDIDGVLAALGEDGPFLLLGASFGGSVASAYAVAHPDRVVGMVLLDASTGVDHDIDELHGFQGACLEANRQADAWDSLEKLDNCSLNEWIRDRRDQEPDVPLLYLAAQDPSARGDVADDPARQAWVESWSPGIWRIVAAPHWMDMADVDLVADAVREVIDLGA
jgi:pimeloyl-ACP methyl ester carboxylesterase